MEPYQLLEQYSTQVRKINRQLPRQFAASPWVGVEIHLGGHSFLSPISHCLEVMAMRPCARVPRSQAWLLGVANRRGQLMPVTQVEHWWTGQPVPAIRPRIVVVAHDHAVFGLQFQQVSGMLRLQNYRAAQEPMGTKTCPSLGPWAPVVKEWIHSGDQQWPVIDFSKLLTQDTLFRTAEE